MIATSYIASYDVETIRCLRGVERIAHHHLRHGVPATFFVVGELLEDATWASELKSILDSPTFDIQNHSFSHLRLKFGAEADKEFLRILEHEVSETSNLIGTRLNRSVSGFRTPMGFGSGLRGEPGLLKVLWRCGIRFVSSQVMGPRDTVPVPLSEPFFYDEEDILHPILELPAHGWHDNVLKGYNYCPVAWPPAAGPAYPASAPTTPDGEFSVWKAWLEHAAGVRATYFAPIFHPWSVYRLSRDATTIEMICEHVVATQTPTITYREMFLRVSEEQAV